jgi:hypothetical protein
MPSNPFTVQTAKAGPLLFFDPKDETTIETTAARNRLEAYR